MNIKWDIANITDFKLALKRFRRYLEGQGMREATITGYMGNAGRYLKFAKSDRPLNQDFERFRDNLAERKVSRSTKNQIPYYFDKNDGIKVFNVIRKIKHIAMLQTVFYACLRSSELGIVQLRCF